MMLNLIHNFRRSRKSLLSLATGPPHANSSASVQGARKNDLERHLSTSPTPPRFKVKKILALDAGSNVSSDGGAGIRVKVQGWVRTVREQKNFAFLAVNDGSCLKDLQVVADADLPSYPVLKTLSTGAAVEIIGILKSSEGKGQQVELKADHLQLVGACPAEGYPLQKKRHSQEFLRTVAHLRPRTNTIAAVARVRSALAYATHIFFQQEGFVYLQTPLITAADCEGAGEMFRVTTLPIDRPAALPTVGRGTGSSTSTGTGNSTGTSTGTSSSAGKQQGQVPLPSPSPSEEVQGVSDASASSGAGLTDFSADFFGKPAFLTVSGQLSGETYACAMGDIYTFGPTFRAENSQTTRHLAEFHMIEPEMAFADLHAAMNNAEAYVKFVVGHAMQSCGEDLAFFQKYNDESLLARLHTLVSAPFARVSYCDAIALLQQEIAKDPKKWQFPKVAFGTDLATEHERWLAEKHFKSCVFVHDYPRAIKSFYMRDNDNDKGSGSSSGSGSDSSEGGGQTCASFDLLVPGVGELIGGSQREERLDVLQRKMADFGLRESDYSWYLDLRRYGSVPHAGYGLGFERLVCYVTAVENIREAIAYPRYAGSAEF